MKREVTNSDALPVAGTEAKRPSGVPEGPTAAEQGARLQALESEILVLNERVRCLARRQASPADLSSCPEVVELSADCQLEPSDGFHELEYDAEGRPYRWTGPSSVFGFDVLVDRSAPRQLLLNLGGACAEDVLEGLRAFIDGEEVRLERGSPSEEGYITLTGALPQAQAAGAARIWFFVPTVVAPSDVDPLSGDERKLGVAFASLSVR